MPTTAQLSHASSLEGQSTPALPNMLRDFLVRQRTTSEGYWGAVSIESTRVVYIGTTTAMLDVDYR
jgi:hypothetical protein